MDETHINLLRDTFAHGLDAVRAEIGGMKGELAGVVRELNGVKRQTEKTNGRVTTLEERAAREDGAAEERELLVKVEDDRTHARRWRVELMVGAAAVVAGGGLIDSLLRHFAGL